MTSPRVYLITGASGRLGRALCRSLGEEAIVAAQYYTRPLNATADGDAGRSSWASTPGIFPVRADLISPGAVESMVDAVLERCGRVDCIINAAVRSHWAPMTTPGFWQTVTPQVHLNAIVPLHLGLLVLERSWRSAFPSTNRALGRSIVNISSTAGSIAYPGRGQSGYSASKAALEMLTRHMALEFDAAGVRVNAVAPNAFPQIVTTERVVAAVRRFADVAAAGTGHIDILDR